MRVRTRPLAAGLGLAAFASIALAAGPAQAAGPIDDGWVALDLGKAYVATTKYAYEPLAIKDGYARTDVCVSSPLGGMGYHYVHLGKNGVPDQFGTNPAKPAAVLYEKDTHGKRKIVALEYIVPYTGQQKAPVIFGLPMEGPEVIPGVGNIYSRHVWLYKKNPKGLFEAWNPKVKCLS